MAVETLPTREQVHVSGLVERTRRLQSDNYRLEQELERLGEKNVELAFQLVEMETRLQKATEQKIENQALREYRSRVADLEEQLRLRDERIRELEQKSAPATDTTAHLLVQRLEPLLGASAAHLVERVFLRAGVALDCRESAAVEPALIKLEEAAGRLLADPERARQLRRVLEELRPELLQHSSPRVVQAMARLIRRRTPSVDLEATPPVRLRAAEKFAPVPLDETGDGPGENESREMPQPEGQMGDGSREMGEEVGAREMPQPQATIPEPVWAPIPESLPPQSPPSPLSNLPSQSDSEPWSYQECTPELPELRTDFDPELGREVALAREQVNAAEYGLALETLVPLRESYPHSLEAAELHFLALAGLRRHSEALPLGRRLAQQCRRYEPFVDAFTRVLEDTHGKSAQERKQALLDLVELHLEDTQRALGYLRQAELLPDRFPGGERLDFHAVSLLAGRREDRRPYLLDSMGWVDRPEVFEYLWQVYNEPRAANEASSARAIVALGKVGRKLAENSEKQARLLQREPLTGLPEAGEVEETACVRFLEGLCERASLGPVRPSVPFLRRMAGGQSAEPGWLPLPEAALFGLSRVQVARYAGPEEFLVEAHRDELGQATLVVHEQLESLPECEQAYLLHRALYQVARGHASLRHRRANLSVGHVRRLVAACRSWLTERGLTLPEPNGDPVADLREVCQATRSHEAGYLLELLTSEHPFADILDRPADHFARRHSSLVGASYALLREAAPELVAQVERDGFRALYDRPELRQLRLRLQRMWAQPLRV